MNNQPPPISHPGLFPTDGLGMRIFSTAFGLFLGLGLLKFGNPPVMEKMVTPPGDIYELLIGSPWPIGWGHALLAGVAILGIGLAWWPRSALAWWPGLALAGWFVWQILSAAQSVDPGLTRATLWHWGSVVVCFGLGFFVLSGVGNPTGFWLGLLAGYVGVILAGFHQQFGGLEDTRRYFFQYIYPNLKTIEPEYLKKVSSNRIFSTLFYPNSLAACLLLLVPVLMVVVWRLAEDRFTPPARVFLVGLLGVSGGACLYWSGSKAGWLVAVALGAVVLWRLPLAGKLKWGLLVAGVALGLAGFAWKYALFFERGATSVVARADYWQAAVQTAIERPILGSGPGTFGVAYQKVKKPESEMARLTHNDYLQQASDSGIPGFLLYLAFVLGGLGVTGRHAWEDSLRFAVWLGLLGWFLHSVVEFNLYVPSLAWISFALLGWLVAGSIALDRPLQRSIGSACRP